MDFLHRFQSGFRPGDSRVTQLVYIVHKIYECLDRCSEAFDKLLVKLKNP